MTYSTVFVLGAGASKQAMFPLYSELLSLDYVERLIATFNSLTAAQTYNWDLEPLRQDCIRLAGRRLKLEELLAELEHTDVVEYERAIRYYLGILSVAWTVMGEDIFNSRYQYLTTFAYYLLNCPQERIDLISFNHDLVMNPALGLIDQSAYEQPWANLRFAWLQGSHRSLREANEDTLGAMFQRVGCTYIMPPDSIPPNGFLLGHHVNDATRKVVIHKLHGSQDWLMCPNCHANLIASDDLYFSPSTGDCWRCAKPLISTIVPPKRVKDYSLHTYQWTRAAEKLEHADQVIFIGYSMPAYDSDAIAFFQRTIPAHAEIVVIDPNMSAEMAARFRTLPGSRHLGVRATLDAYLAYIIATLEQPPLLPLDSFTLKASPVTASPGLAKLTNAPIDGPSAVASDQHVHESRIWSDYAFALGERGRYEESLTASERALDLDPTNFRAWGNKSRALQGLQRYLEAIDAEHHVLALEPNTPIAWHNIANALCALGQYDEAHAACQRALQLDPGFALAWANQGQIYILSGQYAEGLIALEIALRIDPTFARAWQIKASMLGRLQRDEEALTAWMHVVELDPENAVAWAMLGAAHGALGHTQDSLNALDHALELGLTGTHISEELVLRVREQVIQAQGRPIEKV